MTNKTLAFASLLSFGLAAIHIFGGEADVHVPLLDSNASDIVKSFASVVWHGVSTNLLICSAMLLIAARSITHRTMLTGLVIANFLAFTGLFIFYGITRFGSIFVILPWIGFVVIILVATVGFSLDKRQGRSLS